MVRSRIKADSVPEVEAAVRTMFSAIEEAGPQGIHYTSYKLADGQTFLAVLELEDGIDNPLSALSAFRQLQENLRTWLAEPPTPEQATVIGSYDG